MPPLPAHRGFHPIDSGESQAPLTAIKVLSGFQIALGCLSMVVQGIFTGIMLLHVQPAMRHFLISFGIWGGIVFLITGILGLRLRKGHFSHLHDLTSPTKHGNDRALATAFLTMNIISAICAGVLFALSVVNLFWLSHRPLFPAPFYVMRHGEIYLYLPLTGVLLAAGVLELVLSAVSASLCCSLRFKCCHRRAPAGRHRNFTDYPSSTMDTPTGSIARRMRSYSQFSLVPPAAFPGAAVSVSHPVPVPNFAGVPPPPSYEEAWDLSNCAPVGAGPPADRTRESRSNARVYQNLQSARQSRTSF